MRTRKRNQNNIPMTMSTQTRNMLFFWGTLFPGILMQSYAFSHTFDVRFFPTFVFSFIIGAYLFGIMTRDKTKKTSRFTFTKNRVLYIDDTVNLANHNNYYKNKELEKDAKKSIWKSLYRTHFIVGVLWLLILAVIYTALFLSIMTSLHFPDIAHVFAYITGLIIAIFLIMKLRIFYTSKLRSGKNRYLFFDIHAQNHYFYSQINILGGYDYIFQKD